MKKLCIFETSNKQTVMQQATFTQLQARFQQADQAWLAYCTASTADRKKMAPYKTLKANMYATRRQLDQWIKENA